MRISEKARYSSVRSKIAGAKGQNAIALDRLSSQKNITKVSDNPTGAMQIIKHRNTIENNRQYQKNVDYSLGFIESTGNALQGITDSLIRARELSVAMSNDTYDSKSREATAREIKQVIDTVIQQANTSYNGHYIFGGFRKSNPPVTIEGSYAGDDGSILIPMAEGRFQKINVNARNLFGVTPEEAKTGEYGMIDSLKLLYEGLQANDKNQIHKAMNALDGQLDKASSYQASVGAISNSISSLAANLETEEVSMRKNLSEIQDVDIYDATSEFKRSEAVLEGTLMASKKLLQPSLMNYLQ